MSIPSKYFKKLSTDLWSQLVRDENGVERSVFDSDGSLYQGGTKVTATAAALDAATAALANRGVLATSGVTKACLVNGLTVIAGGTGIADLTIAAPTIGARAVIRIASIASGTVVVTTTTGVTLNGTNKIATFNAAEDALVLVYKAANTWEVELNAGAVVLSGT